jgi:hypothetical protein
MTSTSDVSFRPEHRSLIAMRSGETPVFADARAEGASLFTPLLFLLTLLQIQGAHIWRLYPPDMGFAAYRPSIHIDRFSSPLLR